MSNTLFGDGKASGFRMKRLEMYNWGLIDGNTEVVVDDESFLVSGANGSGKTSIVDALQCLLVKKQDRCFNASTEDAKKRDRSETTYLLGKISEVGTEDMFLRKRDTVGMLLASFEDPTEVSGPLTLFAMLYFPPVTGAPNIKYGIARQLLTLKEICATVEAAGISIAPRTRWSSVLVQKYGMTIYSEKENAAYFNEIYNLFGFRSHDNAASLFASLIGKRNLQDTQEFIRENVLAKDEKEAKEESFDDLLKNINISRDMYDKTRRIKRQTAAITRVHDALVAYDMAQKDFESANHMIGMEQGWYFVHRQDGLKLQIDAVTQEIELYGSETERIQRDIASLEKDRDDIIAQIHANGDGGIRDQKRKVTDLRNKLDSCRSQLQQLSKALTDWESNFDRPVVRPADEASFVTIIGALAPDKARLEKQQDELLDSIGDIKARINKLENERRTLQTNLKYLEDRTESIPFENAERRDALAAVVGVPKEMLPLGGELLEIKEDAGKWDGPIRHLLEPFALTVIAPVEHAETIKAYMAKNAETEHYSVMFADLSAPAAEVPSEGILSFVGIKDDSPYAPWVRSYLGTRFSHVFTEDLDAITPSADNPMLFGDALHTSGLECTFFSVRTPGRHLPPYYYGWKDNTAARNQLKEDIKSLTDEIDANLEDERNATLTRKKIESAISEISVIMGRWSSWDEMDVESVRMKYEDEENQLRLLMDNDPNKALTERKDELSRRIAELNADKDTNISHTGGLKNRLDSLESQLVPQDITEADRAAAKKYEELRSECAGVDFEGLEPLHKVMHEKEKIAQQNCQKKVNGCKDTVERAMRDYINPKLGPDEKHLDWSSAIEVGDTLADREWYEAEYGKMTAVDFNNGEMDMYRFIETYMLGEISTYDNRMAKRFRNLEKAVEEFNETLRYIPFNEERGTHLRLRIEYTPTTDQTTFDKKFAACNIDPATWAYDRAAAMERFVKNTLDLITYYENYKNKATYLTDVRMRFDYIVEAVDADGEVVDIYRSTSSRSGGEKAKITYTLLAASIAYQFRLKGDEDNIAPLRFVILDEAFAASDNANSRYVLELFKKMDVQVMVVTPNDKVYIAVDYVGSIIFAARNEHTGTGVLIHCDSSDKEILRRILEENE